MEAEQASSENGTSGGPEALELSYDKVLSSVTQVCYLCTQYALKLIHDCKDKPNTHTCQFLKKYTTGNLHFPSVSGAFA
jgi:hypothetical protein